MRVSNMLVRAEIIDDISDHTDTTNTRLLRETQHIKILDHKSGACCRFSQTLIEYFSARCIR